MKNFAIAVTAAVMLAGAWHVRSRAQTPCLHASDEDATQHARRMAALKVVRAINTAEMNESFRKTSRYSALNDLTVDLAAPRALSHRSRQTEAVTRCS